MILDRLEAVMQPIDDFKDGEKLVITVTILDSLDGGARSKNTGTS